MTHKIEPDPHAWAADEPLWDTRDMATHAKLAAVTIEKMRLRGDGPAFVKLGKSVRYRPVDGRAWIVSRVVRSTSEGV